MHFTLQRRDVIIWDTVWKVEHGTFKAMLGKSSRKIESEVEFLNVL